MAGQLDHLDTCRRELVVSGDHHDTATTLKTCDNRLPASTGSNSKPGLMTDNDARTGMPFRILKGTICVQRFDDSLNSAIRITYHISLRSSSMPEPRDPLLKVLIIILSSDNTFFRRF
jgi:hypothetical protein